MMGSELAKSSRSVFSEINFSSSFPLNDHPMWSLAISVMDVVKENANENE